ncbi:MAG TPA: hypothetical protein VFW63_00020 [Acidimicrobiales bacterium]|nr:hypothetical protein [Acidimicrobiales bacterium]
MSETTDSTAEGEAVPSVDWQALRELVAEDDGAPGQRRRATALGAAVAAWVAAFVLVWMTWDQIASRDIVADQLPWLASGGLGALVLAIVGGACLVVAFLPTGSGGPRSGS